jgi:signal transduction histidine kinase
VARILVIDDNPQDRRLARRAIEQEFADAQLVDVSDGPALAAALDTAPFDAVVTDFRLRWIDGLQILRELKQRFPDQPVVMFTDSGSEEVAAEGFRGGLSDYILKGAGQYVRLAHGVRRAIERARAKQIERELLVREQEARLFAEEANRVKDQFLATLSHELRTPLNAIAGWVSMLPLHLDDPAEVRRCIDRASRNVRLLGRIIDDLTDISRIAAGKLSLDPARVVLATVVRAAIDSIQEAARAKSIRIAFTEASGGIAVVGDVDRLQQVALNLLTNAVKFTPEGGEVSVHIATDAHQAIMTVQDTGQGFKPEFVARAFDRFSQQDAGPARPHDGLGLGLALVRDLVDMHGGTVSIASPGEHQGTTVVVTLPAAADSSGPIAPTKRQDIARGTST